MSIAFICDLNFEYVLICLVLKLVKNDKNIFKNNNINVYFNKVYHDLLKSYKRSCQY